MTEGLSDTRAPLDFRDYLSVLWRRRLTILLVTIVVFSVGLAWSLKQDNVYEASGKLAIQVGDQASAVPTESKVIEGQLVHMLALEKYPGAGSVSTEQDADSNIIAVTAESSTVNGAVQTVTAHIERVRRIQPSTSAEAVRGGSQGAAAQDRSAPTTDRPPQRADRRVVQPQSRHLEHLAGYRTAAQHARRGATRAQGSAANACDRQRTGDFGSIRDQ